MLAHTRCVAALPLVATAALGRGDVSFVAPRAVRAVPLLECFADWSIRSEAVLVGLLEERREVEAVGWRLI